MAARLHGDGGAPVVGGEGGRAAEVPLTMAHLMVATANAAARRGGRRPAAANLVHAAAALRCTGELGRWGKRKRATRGSFIKHWIEEIELQTRGIDLGKIKTRF